MTEQKNVSIPSENKFSVVDLFSKSEIINKQDYKALSDSKEFIIETFLSVPMYRTLPIKLFGVLNNVDFPTPDSKFWQCKVEAEVHACEMIREMHDLELQKNNLERSIHTLNKMIDLFEIEKDPVKKADIGFDIKEQQIHISKRKFEIKQLEKKIKYRIEEVNEWRQISEKISESPGFTEQNYAQMLTEALLQKWSNKLQDPKINEMEKRSIEMQMAALQKISSANRKQ